MKNYEMVEMEQERKRARERVNDLRKIVCMRAWRNNNLCSFFLFVTFLPEDQFVPYSLKEFLLNFCWLCCLCHFWCTYSLILYMCARLMWWYSFNRIYGWNNRICSIPYRSGLPSIIQYIYTKSFHVGYRLLLLLVLFGSLGNKAILVAMAMAI